jgi:hypothetical protein
VITKHGAMTEWWITTENSTTKGKSGKNLLQWHVINYKYDMKLPKVESKAPWWAASLPSHLIHASLFATLNMNGVTVLICSMAHNVYYLSFAYRINPLFLANTQAYRTSIAR